jgi:cell division protein FtsW
MARGRRQGQFDYLVFGAVIILIVVGLAALASASSDLGKLRFNDTYYYLKHQFFYGFSLGVVAFLLGYWVNYKKWRRLSPLFLILSLIALILVMTPLGFSSGGAKRWLQLGPLSIQPAELLKLSFVAYLAAWLAGSRAGRERSLTEGFVPFLMISGLIGLLLLIQRSTSAAVILMAAALAIYFVSGAKKRHLVAAALFVFLIVVGFILATPYRLERIKTYLQPEKAAPESIFQLNQALVTIGSGGWFGVGYGQSLSKKYLPERIGDSIFAIIAEEFGFIGSAVIIGLFFLLIARIFILARRCGDRFGQLLLVGFGTIIGLQALIHIGANSGILPLTGVPLPFISYGGTALAVFMAMSGVILNISRQI